MPSRPIAASPAVASLLRQRRKALGLTLRAVEKLAADAGSPIPYSTLSRIEQGLLDPGVKRLQQLLRLYHVPLQAAGDLLDVEDMAGEVPAERDPKALYRAATDAWQRGAIGEALAGLIALRMRAEEFDARLRQKATLSLAVVASSLGKHRLSRHLLDGLLLEEIDPALLVSVLLQSAISWHWLGGHEAALAFLARAEHHVPEDAHLERAWVLHERASILADRADLDGAERALADALEAYRRAGDESGYGRALGVGVRVRILRGDGAAALEAAEAARFHAARHHLNRIATLRRIDEGRAHALLGDAPRAFKALEKALADAIAQDDRSSRFYAHYHLWEVANDSGDESRARLELDAAVYHVRFIDDVTPEANRIREMLARGGKPWPGRTSP